MLKRKCQELGLELPAPPASDIVRAVRSSYDYLVQANASPPATLETRVNRERSRANMTGRLIQNLLSLDVEMDKNVLHFELDNVDDYILKHDQLMTNKRILFFSHNTLKCLAKSAEELSIDGTFEFAPSGAKQMIAFLSTFEKRASIVGIGCLPDKTRSSYDTLLKAFKDWSGIDKTKSIITDFEKGLIESSRTILNPTVQKGCYFHFKTNVFKNICRHGYSDAIQKTYNILCCLAFVPIGYVRDTFETLARNGVIKLDSDFSMYFTHTYIDEGAIYDLSLWNMRDAALNQTLTCNNVAEGKEQVCC